MTEDSFITSGNISHAKHPHTGTEFHKTNVTAVTSILETNNFTISHHIMERHTSDISDNTDRKVQNVLKHCLAFRSGVAESTGIQGNPRLTVLLLYVSADAVVKETLGLVALK